MANSLNPIPASATYWNRDVAIINYEQNKFKPYKDRNFDELVLDGLRGNPPGNYGDMRQSAPFSRTMYNNSYHDRAREGFRYWLIERPKPTKCKYSTGIVLFTCHKLEKITLISNSIPAWFAFLKARLSQSIWNQPWHTPTKFTVIEREWYVFIRSLEL